MRNVLILLSSIFTGAVASPVSVEGYVSKSISIDCLYSLENAAHRKLFCRTDCFYAYRKILAGSESPSDERFSLRDNKTVGVFTVTITDLRPEDEGTFWCIVQKDNAADEFSKVLLLVKQALSTITTISPSTSTPKTSTFYTISPCSSVSTKVLWLGVGFLLSLLVLVPLVAVMLCRRKRVRATSLLYINANRNDSSAREEARVDLDQSYTALDKNRENHVYERLNIN